MLAEVKQDHRGTRKEEHIVKRAEMRRRENNVTQTQERREEG